MMLVKPSEFPGSHERHLLRRAANPLFGGMSAAELPELSDDTLLKAQQTDHELLLIFMAEFRRLLHEVSVLDERTDSDTVLALKDRLDRAYETASAVADDQQDTKVALSRLLALVMRSIRREAGADQQALTELDQEDTARSTHFRLLESPLVADLLNPQSVIRANELVATLLSADKADLLAALQLFDLSQLEALLLQAEQLLAALPATASATAAAAEKRMILIREYIRYIQAANPVE